MAKKKFYRYEGPGLWLGCTIIMQAFNIEDAEVAVIEELNSLGFKYKGRDSLYEIKTNPRGVFHVDTGNY